MPMKEDAKAVANMNPLKTLSGMGVRSKHLYMAGFWAIGISAVSWLVARGRDDAKPQSDRWGLFFGEWAPTLFAIGVGLRLEEDRDE